VDEAASIEVLCVDKTGTLTRNELAVTVVHALSGFDESHVLGMAALASSDGGQDSVDAAIRTAAGGKAASDLPKLIKFIPFDPGTKMSEAIASDSKGTIRIVKGAFVTVPLSPQRYRLMPPRRRMNLKRRGSVFWLSQLVHPRL